MVLPLLTALVLALLAVNVRAGNVPPGILLAAPRPAGSSGWRLDAQENLESGSLVHGLTVARECASRIGVSAGTLVRARQAPGGVPERYGQGELGVSWRPWRQGEGPPADLGLAAVGSDSRFTLRPRHAPAFVSGERTVSLVLHAARSSGWIEVQGALTWSSRFFKFRRVRLEYLAGGLGLTLGPPAGPVRLFAEGSPWLANPDHLDRPWSAGVQLGGAGAATLAAFATNTYGSTISDTLAALPHTVWGLRLTCAP